jgi:hypothetical protein
MKPFQAAAYKATGVRPGSDMHAARAMLCLHVLPASQYPAHSRPFKTRKIWAKVRKIVAGKDQNTPSDLLEKVPNF